jgi:hypothetical protein
MKYTVEMGSGAMMHVSDFIKIGSGIQKLLWGGDLKRDKSHKRTFSFQNKESRLIKISGTGTEKFCC